MDAFELLKDSGETAIHKHGSTYDDANDKYPFCICPECISQNTRVSMGTDVHDGHYTGLDYVVRHGIFYYKTMYVNYICNDCGCNWQKQYVCKADRRSILSDDVNGNVACAIISFMICVFLVISAACAISICNLYAVDAVPWYIQLWARLSILGYIISGTISFLSLSGW